MSELARRYAQALWQVSPDGEALERTARALMEEPALWEALCSPAVQAAYSALSRSMAELMMIPTSEPDK